MARPTGSAELVRTLFARTRLIELERKDGVRYRGMLSTDRRRRSRTAEKLPAERARLDAVGAAEHRSR